MHNYLLDAFLVESAPSADSLWSRRALRLVGFLLATELLLDFLQRLVLRLRHQEEHEHGTQHAAPGEQSERDTAVVVVQQRLIRLDDTELDQRREHTDDSDGQSFEFRAEELSDHDAGYGPDAQCERADVDSQADEWYEIESRHVDAVLWLPKVESQGT